MTDIYYARTGSNLTDERKYWEPLSDHLSAVAETAAIFATIFGAEAAGRAAGALHDIGKACREFQAYLGGRPTRIDHSAAGAVLAVKRYGPFVGKLIAAAIAGHHAGLANGGKRLGGGLTPLGLRLERCTPPKIGPDLDFAPPAEDVEAVSVRFGLDEEDGDGDSGPSFPAQFLARMLFSCLVDADRLEAERYGARLNGKAVERGCEVPLATLLERLTRYMDEKFGGDPAGRTPVQEVRAQVLDAAIAHAGLAPGLFSLTVPTGGGKTLASLRFALEHAKTHGLRRVIYVIPFVSIIDQTVKVFRDAFQADDVVLEHHSGFESPLAKGSDSDDEGRDGSKKLLLAADNWDWPVVVTTAVQFFESLFSNRPSRCRKLHNIAGAVVILDEAQTLPLGLLRPCLEAVRELAQGYGCSVVLCTATQPAVRREDGFTDGLDGVRELAPDPQALYRCLKRVTVTPLGPLDDQALVERLVEQPQVLCIVNNRRHARELFLGIKGQPGARLLTTTLCAAHRREILEEIRHDLNQGRPVRLVATSLIEAGVDVSFPVVYRATAGLDSVAQAAGRCNRNGELERLGRLGQVFMFDPTGTEHHPPPELKQFAETAQEILRKHAADPLSLDAVQAYFHKLYWVRTPENLDAAPVGEDKLRGILKALDNTKHYDFPYADIAAAFRMIESPMVPVIVPFKPKDQPKDEPGIVAKLLRDLQFVPSPGATARKLQPYLVQIPPDARSKLIAAGAAQIIREKDFGDQFVCLTNDDLYHQDIGLDWDDPTYRTIESGML